MSSTSFGSRVGAEADVVREDHRADDVVVAVHGVDAVEQRDLQARLDRLRLVHLVHRRPVLDAVRSRIRAAAAQHRSDEERRDVGRVLDVLVIGLRHLPDLLFERHLRDDGRDLGIERLQPGLRGHAGRLREGHAGRGHDKGGDCRGAKHEESLGAPGMGECHGRVLCAI